jgi:transposase-like protein
MHTMTKRQAKSGTIDVKALLAEDEEFLRALVRTALQEVLEAEMSEALGAKKGERADSGGSRPRIRADVAHHSDLMSLGVPR